MPRQENILWVDGEWMPWREATIPLTTHGLFYASSVFDGLRVYQGSIFKLVPHVERLFCSAKTLRLKLPFTKEVITEAIQKAVEKNNIQNGYIRPMVWKGSESIQMYAPDNRVHVAVIAWELTPHPERKTIIRNEGVRLKTAEWRRPSEKVIPIQCKASGFYITNATSRERAREEGFDDVLMLDEKERITEGATSNFFTVKKGVLYTPPATYVFNGITRQSVIVLAQELGMKVVEKDLGLADLSRDNEIFLTGTADEITPVRLVNKNTFSVGPVTRELLNAFDVMVY